MSNHHEADGKRSSVIQEMLKAQMKEAIGPTGRFPGGKLALEDQGELIYMVGTKEGRVVIGFKNPVDWVAMEPDDAVALAQLLVKHACSVSKTPITFEFSG